MQLILSNFSLLIKYFYMSFLCSCRDLQIFKGKSLPADGWFVYDMASFQNATRGIVLFGF